VITRLQSLAVFVTCLAAAMSYAGAVTTTGMAFVLTGVVGAAAVGSLLAARRLFGTALILGGALVLAWSEVVNVWSGLADGPAARSTAVASACTLIAVVVAQSSSPALFLLPIAGSLCGALLLGAGSEARTVAVVTAVSAALTLGSIERSRRNWAERPRRGPGVVPVLGLVGAVAAACVLLQVHHDSRPPEALAAGLVYPRIKPPWRDPLGTVTNKIGGLKPTNKSSSPPPPPSSRTHRTNRPPHSQNPPPPKRHNPPTKNPKARSHSHRPLPRSRVVVHQKQPPPSRIWLYVLIGVLVVLLAVAGRLLAVRLAWRRLRRRLASGAPAEQITGAWAWMRIRLDAFRLPLAAAVSPDLVAAGGAGSGLPPEVFAPLQTLAAVTTTAAFAGAESLGADEATGAWSAAGEADASVREISSRRARARLALRGPTSGAKTR
jgi:hypothetical protein